MITQNNPDLLHLARVFVRSYTPVTQGTPKETWEALQGELEVIKRTLPTQEADLFEQVVRSVVEEAGTIEE